MLLKFKPSLFNNEGTDKFCRAVLRNMYFKLRDIMLDGVSKNQSIDTIIPPDIKFRAYGSTHLPNLKGMMKTLITNSEGAEINNTLYVVDRHQV